jgi:3-isopropylmalate dehydrogenase
VRKTARIVLLPGDGVGPEVVAEARRVLEAVGERRGVAFEFVEAAIGGLAIDLHGDPLPAATLAACERADALLLGAVGGPQWSDPTAPVRPEQGLLALRQRFELFANLRPIPVYRCLVHLAPVRAELLAGVDILFVRELTGDVYFGPRQEQGAGVSAHDTMLYTVPEVERIARVAFEAARGRRRKLTSVDKANVLASMRLWRRTVERVACEYPDVELEHALVDSCAMHLVRRPASFDVVLAGNLFGDILSDEASVLSGSLGMLPSASLGSGGFGLYEPVHGSAPDIAGRGIANPVGAILSAAMLLRSSLGREGEAAAVERAVERALEGGALTADLAAPGAPALSTRAMGDAILLRLDEELGAPAAAAR